MATSVRWRLAKLERAAASDPGARGRACGHLLHRERGQIDPMVEYRVHRGDPGEPPIEGPEVCPSCGRRLIYRAEFDRGRG